MSLLEVLDILDVFLTQSLIYILVVSSSKQYVCLCLCMSVCVCVCEEFAFA